MSKVYHRLYYHAVWSTYLRESVITAQIEKVLHPFLENKAKRFHCRAHAVGGVEDHLHIAIEIPPAESVSDIIGKLKGSSSYFLNKELQITENFAWQDGFGIVSFAEKDLPRILAYIRNQKEHHKTGSVNTILERMDEEDENQR